MQKIRVCCFLLALFALPGLHAQVLDLVTSPYESERRAGVEALARAFRAEPDQLEFWLNHENAEVRAASLRAWALAAERVSDLTRAFVRLSALKDRTVRRAVAIDLMTSAIRNWRGEPAILDASALEDPDLILAARAAIQQELMTLAQGGTQVTEHAAMAALTVLGPLSETTLAKIAVSPSTPIAMRSLAVSALARTDNLDFFCDADGKIAKSLHTLLNSNFDSVKLGALYGAAFRGLNSKIFLMEICHYLREDAFNEYTIEAALYLLHTRGSKPLAAIQPEIDLCLKEFLDGLYSQRARYHCAYLMAACGFGDAVDAALQVVEDDCQFSSYWIVATVLNGLSELPEDRAQAVEARALGLSLRADSTPQLRALALWYLTDKGREIPAGLEPESVIKAVHESMTDLSAADRDPDFYAIRSGLEVLSFLNDKGLEAFIRTYLGHESEAVRMAAANAAAQADCRSLKDDVAKLLDKPFEYAGFAAAMATDHFGDERGAAWLARYLASGNSCLMPSALSYLRKKFGKQLMEGDSQLPSDYRRRSALWLAEIAAQKAD